MADTRVTYVTVTPGADSPEELAEARITHIGGTVWRQTVEQVIESIERGFDRFYTVVNAEVSWLVVVDGVHGKFLRTRRKDEWTADLLSLPDFPRILPPPVCPAGPQFNRLRS